ncbi:MAG: polysaccharide deacetylase family protein [Candidatus Bathyarchaeota archaeon]
MEKKPSNLAGKPRAQESTLLVKLLLNILTIDFEEWHNPQYVKDRCPENRRSNATQDIHLTLDLLEKYRTEATIFVVGEIAQDHPELIEQIRDSGHELGFHGYDHEPLWEKTDREFQSEVKLFNSTIGGKCVGFRAPSFSIDDKTKWALKVLEESGYKYDSSIFPVKTSLYGIKDAPLNPYKPSFNDLTKQDPNRKLWEFPLLVYPLLRFRIPAAGGFYLRLFPLSLIINAIKKANRNGYPAILYIHTWELNPETPRLKLGFYRTFVTYHNLDGTCAKFGRILSLYEFTGIRDFMEREGYD